MASSVQLLVQTYGMGLSSFPCLLYVRLTFQKSPVRNEVPCHRVTWKSGDIAPYLLNIDCAWKWVFSFTRWAHYHRRKNSRCPPNRWLSEPWNRPGLILSYSSICWPWQLVKSTNCKSPHYVFSPPCLLLLCFVVRCYPQYSAVNTLNLLKCLPLALIM